MMIATVFPYVLITATVFCGLVAGLLFAFAIVVMPGIRTLGDSEFVRAFQVMDGVIQRNQPLFMVVWAGSVLTLVAAAAMAPGPGQLEPGARGIVWAAAVLYVVGVQFPTMIVNIPLNNRLQSMDASKIESAAPARRAFESRWNRWNRIRTIVCTVVVGLLVLALQLI